MPLHFKEHVRDAIDDDIYASTDLSVSVPKYRFPPHEQSPRHAYSIIHDELMLDGNSRMNLATFCQTWLEPEVHQLMSECIDKNMIDRDEYPQTAEIESRCVHMLAELWHSPAAANTIGCSTTGSSEACMLGGLAAKWRVARAIETRRQNAGNAQYRVGRRSGLLAQVREVFRSRGASDPAGSESICDDSRRGAGTRRRKHDCRRAHAWVDHDARIRAGGRDMPGIGRPSASNRHRRTCARRRGIGGLHRPVHPPRRRLGLSLAAREIDQHVGPQVRAVAAGRRLDRAGARRPICRRT